MTTALVAALASFIGAWLTDHGRLSHRDLREFALACCWLSAYFRREPVGTKAHPFLSKKMTIALPPISWRLI